MIGANGVTARFLTAHGVPSLRRVVRSPERWDRIEKIAADLGEKLPADPDAKALEDFLVRRRKADPLRFPDLSLDIVKAMGAGEYVLEAPGEASSGQFGVGALGAPGQASIGHFGLAVRDYAHSTAPNRRFPDLIAHRLLKSALAKGASRLHAGRAGRAGHPLHVAGGRRQQGRAPGAQVGGGLPPLRARGRAVRRHRHRRRGQGSWVRVPAAPVEGKLVHGAEGVDLGDRIRVRLMSVDVEKGFIDFVRTA